MTMARRNYPGPCPSQSRRAGGAKCVFRMLRINQAFGVTGERVDAAD